MTLDVPQSIRRHRLFEQDSVLLRVAPFAIVYLTAFAVYPFGGSETYGASFAAAVVLAAATVASIAWVPWQQLHPALQVLPLLVSLLSVAAFREAHGGASSGYAPLVLVPVVWAAVFGGWRGLAVVVAGVAVTIGLPPLVDSAPEYPAGEFRRAAIFVVVSGIVGVVIQRLVQALLETEARLTRLRAAEVHDDLVQAFAVAQLALESGNTAAAERAVHNGLAAAQALVAEMLTDAMGADPAPGALRRSSVSPSGAAPADASSAT